MADWATEREKLERWRAETFPGPSPLPQYDVEWEIRDTFDRKIVLLTDIQDDEAGD